MSYPSPIIALRSIIGQVQDPHLQERFNVWITEHVKEVGCSVMVDKKDQPFEDIHRYYEKQAFIDIGVRVFKEFANKRVTDNWYGKVSEYRVYVLDGSKSEG